jgi:hypothetical protein
VSAYLPVTFAHVTTGASPEASARALVGLDIYAVPYVGCGRGRWLLLLHGHRRHRRRRRRRQRVWIASWAVYGVCSCGSSILVYTRICTYAEVVAVEVVVVCVRAKCVCRSRLAM